MGTQIKCDQCGQTQDSPGSPEGYSITCANCQAVIESPESSDDASSNSTAQSPAAEVKTRHLFVSYSSLDKPAADSIVAALEADGIDCWMAPRNILPGEKWANAIISAIGSCRAMAVICSANAMASRQIPKEVDRAAHRGIPLIPIRIDATELSEGLEYYLSDCHWLDASKGALEGHLPEMAKKLHQLLEARPISGSSVARAGPGLRIAPKKSPVTWIAIAGAIIIVGSSIAIALHLRGADQSAGANKQNAPGYVVLPMETITNSIGAKLVKLKAGRFNMGSPLSEMDRSADERQHRVILSKPFFIGVTPVTQSQWQKVMGSNPSYFQGDDLPVDSVTWSESVAFCEKLSKLESKTYRLPTEAEWEYACRASSPTAYYSGDSVGELIDYAWFDANSQLQTHPVAQKWPNAWGIYDMMGNVCQWCSDWYGPYSPGDEVPDPVGPPSGTQRILRGGSWFNHAQYCRCANRYFHAPEERVNFFGVRVVREL